MAPSLRTRVSHRLGGLPPPELRPRHGDRGRGVRLEGLEDRLGAGDLERARILDVERLDDAIIDDHRIAFGALAETVCRGVKLEPDRAGEIAVAVGEHEHLAVGLLILAPGAHDESVIHREAADRVDAPLLEFALVLDNTG